MNNSFAKMTLAAVMVSSVAANKSAADLVSQALNIAEVGAEAKLHLENALSALSTGDAATLEKNSQTVAVPIDEKRALTVKVSPTYVLDNINSVTLKSFRKIVGYDTFNSIRKKNRSEEKDISDYYNVTVSMMVQRKPAEAAAAPARDPYAPDGAANLAATLDKGFPYDD